MSGEALLFGLGAVGSTGTPEKIVTKQLVGANPSDMNIGPLIPPANTRFNAIRIEYVG